jgi:hypothetical protein
LHVGLEATPTSFFFKPSAHSANPQQFRDTMLRAPPGVGVLMVNDPSPSEKEFIIHAEPVWRERSNFIINAELGEADFPRRFEQLWARQIGEDRFEICCIPFFLFDIALGDVVKTSPKGDRKYVLETVVERSGRYVFRVWFGESFHPRDEIAEQLTALGALLEWSSMNLLSVDAVDELQAQRVADFLHERQQQGQLMYETGKSA